GLAVVRYSWNTALDAGCTTGTATTSGTTLTAPAGDNTLYLCARDNTGRVGAWSGRYRVGNLPTEPGPTTVGCAYSTGDNCWVTGDFVASVTPSTGGTGALTYRICRSLDSTGGFAGCDVNLTVTGGTSITVAGTHLPSDGFRRAYYFLAQDSVGAYGPWNTPRYVRVDRYAPAVSATNASDTWFPSRTATISAGDTTGGAGANSGLVAVRYSWNVALNAACTTGTETSSGATLTAPAGDNLLYLCGIDNTGRVGTWNGRYRVGATPLTVTTTPSPAQSPYGTAIFWRATAIGGDPATRQYALFRRRPGGAWNPGLTSPSWQAGTNLGWTPTSNNLGVWEIQIWVKDANTLPGENTYGYTDSFDPGNVEVVAPAGFALNLSPSTVSVSPGGQAQYTVSLTPEAGFTGTAALSVSGLPAAATHTLEPAAIGAGSTATLTVSTTTGTPPGDSTLTITGTASGLTRTATAQLRVVNGQKPVLNSISPESFGNGGRVRVTVQGSVLSGSTVSIAQEQTDPDDPVSRVFPTAQLISINPSGTSMVVEIDATDTRIMDFHNLVVDNGADIEAIQFRVLPGGPLVDAWTPSQPEVGLIHALSIAGRNLAGTTITPSVGGRILLHSVETSDTEITALLEVLPNAQTGPMSLIVSDGSGRTVSVPITVVPPQKSLLKKHNLTESRNGEKIGGGYSRRPAIWFQEFVIRDPDHTEVLDKGLGLRIQPLDAETIAERRASNKAISFELYIKVTIPLVRVQWQKVILFDPITGAIGDAVLQALGVGARVPIGAFVISAYFQMDLTIYFRLTNAGFTFPRFCIEITYGIEITGFDGFAYNQSFCVGGGWYAFGTGSVSSGEITGGECASVTRTNFADGIIEGEVQQNACCSQPIGVAMSGNTFTGLAWGRSFSINNPQAGTTSSNQATCPCPCTVSLDGTALTPGGSTTGNVNLKNTSAASCTYQYEVKQAASGQTQMNLSNNQGLVTVGANQTVARAVTVSFPNNRPAPDAATLEVTVLHTDSGGTPHVACQSSKISCVYPTGETSSFLGWWPVEPSDVARFLGQLTPTSTDFSGRAVTEVVPGSNSFDNCYGAGSPFPNYAVNNLSGGIWDIVAGNNYHEADLIGMKCTPQHCDLDQFYKSVGRTPCTMGTTQKMQMSCGPMQPGTPIIPYADNTILFNVTDSGTTIKRDNATSPLH
ncbi:MAG TPA: hypothetical protein VLE27_13745, partial [Thermoanaerobaculia bacterium]|nr:hypothetical protein [Thermoanaerobaculia bacterium]